MDEQRQLLEQAQEQLKAQKAQLVSMASAAAMPSTPAASNGLTTTSLDATAWFAAAADKSRVRASTGSLKVDSPMSQFNVSPGAYTPQRTMSSRTMGSSPASSEEDGCAPGPRRLCCCPRGCSGSMHAWGMGRRSSGMCLQVAGSALKNHIRDRDPPRKSSLNTKACGKQQHCTMLAAAAVGAVSACCIL
jgi:hypothetical protein